jgi:hypothetical protein
VKAGLLMLLAAGMATTLTTPNLHNHMSDWDKISTKRTARSVASSYKFSHFQKPVLKVVVGKSSKSEGEHGAFTLASLPLSVLPLTMIPTEMLTTPYLHNQRTDLDNSSMRRIVRLVASTSNFSLVDRPTLAGVAARRGYSTVKAAPESHDGARRPQAPASEIGHKTAAPPSAKPRHQHPTSLHCSAYFILHHLHFMELASMEPTRLTVVTGAAAPDNHYQNMRVRSHLIPKNLELRPLAKDTSVAHHR